MRQKLLLSAAVFSMAVGTALAQTSGTSPDTTRSPATTTPPSSMSQGATGSSQSLAALPANAIMGSRLTDMKVRGTGADKDIGEIDDVVLDQDGKIHQVIVSTGGVLGVGGKKVALSWDQVRVDAARQVAVVSMTEDQLKAMPEFKEPERDRDNMRGTAPARAPGAPAPAGTGTTGTGTTR